MGHVDDSWYHTVDPYVVQVRYQCINVSINKSILEKILCIVFRTVLSSPCPVSLPLAVKIQPPVLPQQEATNIITNNLHKPRNTRIATRHAKVDTGIVDESAVALSRGDNTSANFEVAFC